MPKQKHFPLLIMVVSILVGITGLYNDVFFETHDFGVMLLKQLFSPLSLDWGLSSATIRVNGYNYVNAVFDAALLLGGIIYLLSARKSSGLIRLTFSVIFGSNAFSIGYMIFFLVIVHPPLNRTEFGFNALLIDLAFLLVNAFWMYLAYLIIIYFRAQKELATEVHDYNGENVSFLMPASKWQRFFHYIFDFLIILTLVPPYIAALTRLWHKEDAFFYRHSDPTIRSLVIFVAVITYYLIYETVLNLTPAKTLTQTRVVNSDSDKPKFKKILIRTLVRLIPMEGLSFFGHTGWHDSVSGTVVVREQELADPDEQVEPI